jgi:hypothetical protein
MTKPWVGNTITCKTLPDVSKHMIYDRFPIGRENPLFKEIGVVPVFWLIPDTYTRVELFASAYAYWYPPIIVLAHKILPLRSDFTMKLACPGGLAVVVEPLGIDILEYVLSPFFSTIG